MIRSALLAFCIVFCAGASMAAYDIAGDKSAKTIVADKIEYNAKDKSIATKGQTKITSEAGQRLTLHDSYLHPNGENAFGNDIEIIANKRLRITAESIQREGGNTTALDSTYTACYDCGDPREAWEISASKLHHDAEEHMIQFWNPVFWLYGVPIFWSPYLTYPDPEVNRKSGLLFPNFNTTNDMGTQFNIPLYIALSDTHDFTITGSYLTRENPLWQLEHRLNLNRSEFRTRGSYTYNRDNQHRWHVFNEDVIEMGEHARTEFFLARASDQIYLQKYGFYNDQPYLDSGFRTELYIDGGYATIESHIFQELRTYQRNRSNPSGNILPQIHGVYQTAPLFADTYVSFTGDILGIQNDKTGSASQRILGIASITSPWILPLGQKITLNASARYDIYNFVDTDMVDGQTGYNGMKARFLPNGYAEWSMPFIRPAGKDGWTQVIEPKVRLTVMQHEDQSSFSLNTDSAGALLSDAALFSDNRFSGYDIWENGNYMDYGIGWSAFSNDGRTAEVFLGQSYDFQDNNGIDPNSGFHDGASDYVGRIKYSDGNWLTIANRFRFDRNSSDLRHLESAARIGQRNYLTIGYIWTQQLEDAETVSSVANEISGGFGVYLTERLALLFGMTYNITDTRMQKQNAGILYDHPCYSLLLEYTNDGARRIDGDGNEYVGHARVRFGFSLKFTGDK